VTVQTVSVYICVSVYIGGSDSTEWEDITGSTHMNVVKGCASFTSAVSARSVRPRHCNLLTSSDVTS